MITAVNRAFKMSAFLLAIMVAWATDVRSASPSSAETSRSTYRAAVYAHTPLVLTDTMRVVTRQRAWEMMAKNLDIYKDQTMKAKQQGGEIVVFPEDGLYGTKFTRESILPFLERIPDPEVIDWSPCKEPSRFPNSEVQHSLSCMAKENGLYLVANMGDNVPCDRNHDLKCPKDGHYQFNTDVAYGPDGKLLAKYHKANLFYENQFDTPVPKVVFFDTPFGRFGMLVCFDLLFEDPAVKMVVDQYNITNIAFPTAWIDALPLLSAIGYHSSFARGLRVNFLSANLHVPLFGFHGSGIYTPEGAADFYYNSRNLSPGKLLVSTIETVPSRPFFEKKDDTADVLKDKIGKDVGNKHEEDNTVKDTESDSEEFHSELFGDMFNFRLLKESLGNIEICQKNVCCSLSYILTDNSMNDTFAFGVFDGLHTLEGQYYFQICTLVKCAERNNRSSCGSSTKGSVTKFTNFSMTGSFQTQFVYPQVVLSNSGEQLYLTNQTSWSFQANTLTTGPGIEKSPVLSAALFGRYYSRDDCLFSFAVRIDCSMLYLLVLCCYIFINCVVMGFCC